MNNEMNKVRTVIIPDLVGGFSLTFQPTVSMELQEEFIKEITLGPTRTKLDAIHSRVLAREQKENENDK